MTGPLLPPFYRLIAHERIDSTNEEAKRLAAAGAPAGTLVWAGEQLSGRGRRGRLWSSPPGNLYMSLLLRPGGAPSRACQVNFVVAVALAETVEALLPGSPVALKWPNDVLVNGAKVSGILLEAGAAPDRSVEWLVVGVGLNIASHPAETPYPATDLRQSGAATATPGQALELFAARFEQWYAAWRDYGFTPVRDRWRLLARGIGGPIEIRLEQETLRGRFADLDETGALLLDMHDGARRQITTGDLFFPQL